ncbi:restriction endonuclease subunit S [Bacteroides fragilis]|nr:restriction endonuclease subunit S [Bacteroides fragilis]MCE8704310.1 restriction endonuclease subunit S [Bacteroides fragilis]MCE9325895.1 restriction endonuclease subunit S [Bacteroides fragilis]MCE9446762.1 restriction endonuclease subunit S [Bacteroides fragilis]
MTTTINNEHKKLNVPNLRFPEFQGEWKRTIFKNVITLQRGSSPRPIIEYVTTSDDGVNWIKIGDMPHFGRIVTSTEEKITKEGAKKSRQVNKGDLILSNSMSYGLPYIMGIDGYIHDGWFVLKNFENTFDKDYLCNLLISSAIQNQYKRLAAGGVVQNISSDLVNSVSVSIPTMMEQKKISSLLNLIDERIATQNKIIEDLKKLKSAISHILFSSKGAIHLSEIANVVMGQSPSSNAYNDQGLGMPLVQGNLDISNGKTTPRLYTAEFNQTTEKGNIILTVRAPVGEVAKATQKVCLGRGVCAIIPHEENMSDFIYQYLTFYKFMWRRYEQGSTFTSINGSDVRNIFCPKVRNVSILTLLDIKINIEERVVKQYQSQKQYMLYQMFI